MRVKRFIALAAAAVMVLAMAGLAVAKHSSKPGKVEAAQATTFTATPSDRSKTRQCTGSDGATYNVTHGVYTGTATGDPRLSGNIVIKAKSVVNLDSGLGTTFGRVWLRGPDSRKPKAAASLKAVNTERGKLDGFLLGSAKNADGKGKTGLAANFSATFNAEGTSLTGELGAEAPVPPQNSAVFFGNPCAKQKKSGHRGRGDDDRKHEGRRDDGRKGDDDGKRG